jgi:hypothetical protein
VKPKERGTAADASMAPSFLQRQAHSSHPAVAIPVSS